MVEWRNFIPIFLVVLAATACVRADMVPTSAWDGAPCPAAADRDVTDRAEPSPARLIGGSVDLETLAFACLPETEVSTAVGIASYDSTPEPVRLLNRDRGSLELCLYALMGLGLCKSAPWFKRLSFSFIPDWYHQGGPYQIGGSHAVGPDCFCSVALCFVQPRNAAADSLLPYRTGTIASLLRQSQFSPNVLSSRGPPRMS
ncbi:MAG: hypothetical protein JW993_12285 [Sedimentisphaerales bacterium]|nr:hypothetical protein [Sedimentisphaerales bacterium]